MGENSGIQWTTHTFNPWVGCQRVSPGCTNCYAEAYDKRVGGLPKNQRKDPSVAELRWGPKAPRVRTSVANWRKPIAWDKAAAKAGERHRVFCSSLADVFEDRADLVEHRRDLFRLIAKTPHLDWLLLTKRPENIARLMPAADSFMPRAPWPNVWLGTTVEDQQRANERIPHLLDVPAVVHFLSMEPLLEAVNLEPLTCPDCGGHDVGGMEAIPGQPGWCTQPWCVECDTEMGDPDWLGVDGIDWVIIGGESGGSARPFHLDWARSLVAQARAAGTAPFVKQLGARPVGTSGEGAGPDSQRLRHMKDSAGGDPDEWPEDLRVREFPRGGA